MPFLERLSLCLSMVGSLLSLFLYGQYIGFLKGEAYAVSAYSVSARLGESGVTFSSTGYDIYQLISHSYLTVFLAFFVTSLIHLAGRKVAFKWLIVLLLFLPARDYWRIFEFKKFAIQDTEFSRFNVLRETIFLDFIGAGVVVCVLVIQLILVFLILKEQEK